MIGFFTFIIGAAFIPILTRYNLVNLCIGVELVILSIPFAALIGIGILQES